MEESRFLGLRNHFVGWTEQSGPEGLSLELGDVCRHGCCQMLLDEDLPPFIRGSNSKHYNFCCREAGLIPWRVQSPVRETLGKKPVEDPATGVEEL